MPHVRNVYYRKIKCPLCQKIISADDQWFCSKQCEEEWNILNMNMKKSIKKKVKGSDTSC
ncbi:MAG: hypothetical protein R6V50_04990 [Thermoplasmatota archaeon]